MYAASQDFIDATAAESRSVKVKAIFNSDPLTEITGESADGSIISLTFDEVMDDMEGLTIGSAGMSQVELTFYMPSTPIALRNGTVQPFIGLVLPDDSIEYVPLGFFWITDISTTDNYKSVTVTAYDNFCKLEEQYTPSSVTSWPAAANDVISDILAQYNMTFDPGFSWPGTIPTLDSYIEGTCREYIGWIAGLLGKNAKFDRSGNLTFSFYSGDETSTGISRDIQYMSGLQSLTDGTVTINSLTSGTEEAPLTTGSGYGVTFYNPFMTQSILDDIFEAVGGLTYAPCECRWRANPALETGDAVNVEMSDGSTIFVLVMRQTIEVTGGMLGTISCYGYTEEGYIISESPTQKEIRKTYTNLVQAIADASALINGARGGIFVVTDSDDDGVNDGWTIADTPDLSAAQNIIKASSGGIGISTDGGATYATAMTAEGINADTITTGTMSAERIYVSTDAIDSGVALSDYFSVSLDGDGHPVVQIGSSANAIILKEQNDRISFYDTNGNELAYFSDNSFEIVNLEYFRLGNLAMTVQSNGSISFVAAED